MSDLGDDFKFLKEIKKEKKSRNVDSSLNLLRHQNLEYKILNEGNWHTLVADRVDFWPSTGKWSFRGLNRNGRGVKAMIRVLREVL